MPVGPGRGSARLSNAPYGFIFMTLFYDNENGIAPPRHQCSFKFTIAEKGFGTRRVGFTRYHLSKLECYWLFRAADAPLLPFYVSGKVNFSFNLSLTFLLGERSQIKTIKWSVNKEQWARMFYVRGKLAGRPPRGRHRPLVMDNISISLYVRLTVL